MSEVDTVLGQVRPPLGFFPLELHVGTKPYSEYMLPVKVLPSRAGAGALEFGVDLEGDLVADRGGVGAETEGRAKQRAAGGEA